MITVQNLCKTYKVAKRKAGMREACRSLFRREYEEIHALDHISFQIEDGETIGYIGPNGAGKSTSIKVLSGILTPDEGTCVAVSYTHLAVSAPCMNHDKFSSWYKTIMRLENLSWFIHGAETA